MEEEFISRKFQDGIMISKDESILEREKGQGYISSMARLTIWISLVVLPGETIKMEELRGVARQGFVIIVTEPTMQIGGHATSAIGR